MFSLRTGLCLRMNQNYFRLDDDDVEKVAFNQELQHSLDVMHSEDGKVSEMLIFCVMQMTDLSNIIKCKRNAVWLNITFKAVQLEKQL